MLNPFAVAAVSPGCCQPCWTITHLQYTMQVPRNLLSRLPRILVSRHHVIAHTSHCDNVRTGAASCRRCRSSFVQTSLRGMQGGRGAKLHAGP